MSGNRTSLGMLVRERREEMRLTMDELAERSRVSRSTVHRIEHNHATRPTAPKLAQILSVLEIEADDVRLVLDDERYLGDVLHWMERSAAFVDVAQALRPRAAMAHAGEGHQDREAADLILYKDGQMAEVRGTGLDELKDALRASGWHVARPVD